MRLLITGSTGFIGYRLAAACRRSGHETIATGLLNNSMEDFRFRSLSELGVRVVRVPAGDRAEMPALLDGCDAVVHLAAAQHEANVPDQHFRDVNVQGTRTLLEQCLEAGVGRFVLGSTIGVFGAAKDGEIGPDTPPRPGNIYEVTKLEAEEVARGFGDRLGICVVRISETYGPGDARLLKLFKTIAKGTFFIIGKGANIHQPIHVDDLTRGLLAAATRDQAVGSALILAGAERLSTRDMCEGIAAAVGTPLRQLGAPMWPFSLAAIGFEAVCRPLGVQPPLHRRRLDFFKKSFFFDTRAVREVLAFEPTISFRAGAAETAAWYRANGFL